MSGSDFRRRDGRRRRAGDGVDDVIEPLHPGPRRKTFRERLQRVVGSPNPYAMTEVSKKEAEQVLAVMCWREKMKKNADAIAVDIDDAMSMPGTRASFAASIPAKSYRGKKRKARYSVGMRSGCDVCAPGLEPLWKNVGSASRHHDATGHNTWSEREVKIWYGVEEEIPKLELGPIGEDEIDDDDDDGEIDVNADLYALLDENENL